MINSLKFIFKQEVQEIFNSFTRLLGIRIVFFGDHDEELKVGDNRELCEYCKLLREKFACIEMCREYDKKKQLEAKANGKMIHYRCYSGMTEAIIPVKVEKQVIGYIMIGQFRTSQEFILPRNLENISKPKLKILKDAFHKAPFYDKEKVAEILKLFEVLVDFIVSHRLIAIKNQDPVQCILEYIRENPTRTLSPQIAAMMVCRSESSISHLFKSATNKSLIQFQIDNKLEIAEKMMTQKPEKSIKEIAIELGFENPLYFSKLYKKKRGISPTDYRKQNNQG